MPSRTIPFVNNEYYHIFNRGVAKMQIFNGINNYKRFIDTMIYYSLDAHKPRFSIFAPTTMNLDVNKKIVEIVCYCLMPNHFHFLLRQVRKGGISEFTSKLTNSYTKYFNTKNRRLGPLFQGDFKAVHIGSDEQLIHLSRYIHLNPLVGYIVKNLDTYKWSSYLEYTSDSENNISGKDIIINLFKSAQTYKQFVLDHKDYGSKLEMIKHQLLDLEG